ICKGGDEAIAIDGLGNSGDVEETNCACRGGGAGAARCHAGAPCSSLRRLRRWQQLTEPARPSTLGATLVDGIEKRIDRQVREQLVALLCVVAGAGVVLHHEAHRSGWAEALCQDFPTSMRI